MPLQLQPLPERDSLSPDFPSQYNSGMAVRRRDKELKDSLQAALDRNDPQIQNILKEFGIPLLPIKQESNDDKDDQPKAAAPLPSASDSSQASKR